MFSTHQPLLLLEVRDGGGTQATAFENRLDLVKKILDNGAIGGPAEKGGWGSEAHLRALEEVERHLAETKAAVEDEIANEMEAGYAGGDGASRCQNQTTTDG